VDVLRRIYVCVYCSHSFPTSHAGVEVPRVRCSGMHRRLGCTSATLTNACMPCDDILDHVAMPAVPFCQATALVWQVTTLGLQRVVVSLARNDCTCGAGFLSR
jgi:hypothetical protein